MNILSVTIIPPGGDAQWWRINNIASVLKTHNCNVDLVHYIVKGGVASKLLENKINYYDEHSIVIASPLHLFLIHLKHLSKKKYDLVYGNTYSGAIFSILGKFKGIPLVLDLHGISEEDLLEDKSKWNFNSFLKNTMQYLALRFSDRIICVSKKMMDYLHTEKKVPLNKMIYGTNGVDLDFFKPASQGEINNLKSSLNLNNKFIIGYVGGFQKYQGIDKFLEITESIKNEDVSFLFVGGDQNLTTNNTVFVSKISRDQLPLYYSVCDILVLPRPNHISMDVAAPTKFAEYCAIGKPILTTDVGDAADLVRQYGIGIVIKDNSPDNLKKGIYDFLSLDKHTLEEMGARSRILAEDEFEWNKISENIFNGIKELT